MKLSTNFVKDYIDVDVETKKLAEDMTQIGNEYDSSEKLINATNLVIGEVKECKMHPDSDHLHICKVDVGSEVLQIVCGAPNVREGLKVIVALVGAELAGNIKIKKGNIRGVESNGMLCSMEELGIESKFLTKEDKEGIHELPEDSIIGEDPIKKLELDDSVIDFELTANRGDLLSVLGMAYEIGAIYNKKVKKVELSYQQTKEDINNSFKIDIKTDNCTLFLAKKVENVIIKESPTFIKNRLIASGIRPINNVVDISNYVMLELGQPLHFYDANTLKDKIEVRMAEENEKLITLDNVERTLAKEDIIISDGEKPIGLAGVMGGLTTEVELTTKSIIIESAIFNPLKVRQTSKKILRSEASNRFEKGLDPNRTYMAIERACHLLEKYANATIVGGLVEYNKENLEDKKIEIELSKINKTLGINIPKEEVLQIFERLGFMCKIEKDTIRVLVPKRRIDIQIKEDLIEEVGRIYGVDKIEGKLPVVPLKVGSYNKTIREVRNKMIALGLNEVLSYILINDKEAKKYTKDEFEIVKLLDPMTEERNTLRYSIIPSLMKIFEYNQARNVKDISIFEIGKGFYKKEEQYGEETKIGALMTGDYYLNIKKEQSDFYTIKGVAEELLDYLGYKNRYSFVVDKKMPQEFHTGQTANIVVNNDIVGVIGKIHPEITKQDVYVFEINLDKLLQKRVGKMKYKEISKYPIIKKDIALIADNEITSQEIENLIKRTAGNLLINIELFDLYTGKGIQKNKKSLAYSLSFGAQERTLTDEEILEKIKKVITNLEQKGIQLRK
ncbi:MAG: phenylalanine--tRNA ligase subunit beta [Clostridia bacterium]|nr:phenylalanine--tRNA ligase subunit beta [Clostridia bacterium]